MLRVLISILCFVPLAVQAANFGDEVVACVAKYKLPPDSHELKEVVKACELDIEAQRASDPSQKVLDAKLRWESCLSNKVMNFDDGVSTASDVASALKYECETEYLAFFLSMDISPEAKLHAYRTRVESTRELAIKLVLLDRVEKRKSQKSKDK